MRGDSRSPDRGGKEKEKDEGKDHAHNEHQKWLMQNGFMSTGGGGNGKDRHANDGKGKFKGGKGEKKGKGKGKDSKGNWDRDRDRERDRDRQSDRHKHDHRDRGTPSPIPRMRDDTDRHGPVGVDRRGSSQRTRGLDDERHRNIRRDADLLRQALQRSRNDSRERPRYRAWNGHDALNFAHGRDRANGKPFNGYHPSGDRWGYGDSREPSFHRSLSDGPGVSVHRWNRDRDDRVGSRGRGARGGGSASEGDIGTSDDATIRIGGCPDDITEKEVSDEFSRFGPIFYLSVRRSNSAIFAFVTYEKVEDALQAIRTMNGAVLFGGCMLEVDSTAG